MATSEFETVIEVNGDELPVVVEYTYSPGTPDVMYLSNGDPGHPGDPAECEVVAVYRKEDTKRTKDLLGTLPTELIESLFEQACEDGPGAEEDAYERAMEDKYDAMKNGDYD